MHIYGFIFLSNYGAGLKDNTNGGRPKSMNKPQFSEMTQVALQTAHLGGEIAKKGFGTSFSVSSKQGNHNLVTEYDNLCEQTMIESIRKVYPDHAFLAEEGGEKNAQNSEEYQWIIDPIDGTVNYAHNVPMFAISIAIRKNSEVLAGVVYQPLLEETFVAEKGKGAFLNGQQIFVSQIKTVKESFLATGFPYNLTEHKHEILQPLVRILSTGVPVRRIGVAALDLAYTACGRFDGFFEYSLAPWDCAAGNLLVEEAQGKISCWDLSPFDIDSYKPILASNGLIHDELTTFLD